MRYTRLTKFSLLAVALGLILVVHGGAGSSRILASTTPSYASIVAVASSSANNNIGTSLSIPVPANVAAGDILVAVVDIQYAPTITPPTGWALIRSDKNPYGNHLLQAEYWHLSGSSEPQNYTWNFFSSHGAVGGIVEYSGVDSTTPVDVSGVSYTNNLSTVTAPSVSVTNASDMLLGIFGLQGDHVMSSPTAMTPEFQTSLLTIPGEKLSAQFADQKLSASGSTGSRTVTASQSSTGTGQTIALRPLQLQTTINTPPVINSVSISPSLPLTNDTLHATVSASDSDGDSLTYSYQWFNNSAPITGATSSSLDLSLNGNGNKGDNITVQVIASDGTYQTSPYLSSSVVVGNSPPSAQVALAPLAPVVSSILTATVTPADADSDPISMTYTWSINGTLVRTVSAITSTSDSLDLSTLSVQAGDIVSVSVIPNDGSVNGPSVSSSVTIVNSSSYGTVGEYPIPGSYVPSNITSGPDGNVWFTTEKGGIIGRLSPGGSITEFTVPSSTSSLGAIVTGPDGNLWFSENSAGKIGKITPQGTVSEFAIPTASSGPGGICRGPDGNLWFAEASASKIGRITPQGAITEYKTLTSSAWPHSITVGPDGNLWFTEFKANKIGRISTAGTNQAEFPVLTASSGLATLTSGADGNIWFAEQTASKVGRLTLSGGVKEFATPTGSAWPIGITSAPDGNLWFTEKNANKVVKLTTAGAMTVYSIPTSSTGPDKITVGPDGNLWFTQHTSNEIATFSLH